jgi:hypothetical protein
VRKFAASVPAEIAAEYFHAGTNARHLATVSRVREPYRPAVARRDSGGQPGPRAHSLEEGNPLDGNCSTPSARRPAFLFSITLRLIFSVNLWYAPRAMPCEVSIHPASMREW